MSRNRKEDSSENHPDTLLETIDDLIFHLNDARSRFMILSITSLVMAPVAIIVAASMIVHPAFIRLLLIREPFAGLLFILYLALTLIISVTSLYVGVREYRFLSKWNERFRRFISLKDRIDRELEAQRKTEE